MPDRPTLHVIDSRRDAHLTFAAPDPVALGPRGRTAPRAPIAVGPGRAVIAEPNRERAEHEAGVSYPIQPGKVQAPALRDETLARTRLLDWLEAKIHSRVIFVIADAGYGKTTLLADFSRRTRLRMIWYRLDEDDRDWVGFLSHLVAAAREHDPGFAPRTVAMLRSLEPRGPTRDEVVETFLSELPSIASQGAALVFDDFHLADEVADVRHITREIVSRAPDRLSIVFASRRQPPVPVSKLRAIGELAELGITDLRFSDSELEELFRDTYRRPLEPDVLSELAKRTEGWAASLTLVQAALRERSPSETRSFIRGLSGARDELHDYLAEEVVGDLPQIHQQFLMRTSILQVVTPELAQVATDLAAVEVQSLILESERLGLLGRRPNRRSTAQRYHPLVREFLEERLLREVGNAGATELHLTVARWAETTDWRTAAHHFAWAHCWDDLRRVLDTHVETIVASGAFAAANEFLSRLPQSDTSPTVAVIRSRVAIAEGDFSGGAALAKRAAEMAPDRDVVIQNLVSAAMLVGRYGEAAGISEDLTRLATSSLMREVAHATTALIACSVDGNLAETARLCEALATRCESDGLTHFEGVSWLNAALCHRAMGDVPRSLASAHHAIDALSIGSPGPELASSRSAEASALALGGRVDDARREFTRLIRQLSGPSRDEVLVEWAEAEVLVGSAESARAILDELASRDVGALKPLVSYVAAAIDLRVGSRGSSFSSLQVLDVNSLGPNPGYRSQVLATLSLAAALLRRSDAAQLAESAMSSARPQVARPWQTIGELAEASVIGRLHAAILGIPEDLRYALCFAAELVVRDLPALDTEASNVIYEVASAFPERWRTAIRRAINEDQPVSVEAARLLDAIGDRTDIPLLRRIAREPKRLGSDRQLGRLLARRLARRIAVRDLGRVSLEMDDGQAADRPVRRKVLALLCFLFTRPRWSATREEVMEALWPDVDPSGALNSLNQTVYFLRREFEPEYSEDTSPGYIHQDSDLLWLDAAFISADSRRCVELIQEFEKGRDPSIAVELASTYRGKFALDFAYEEWATDFREWLHVAYLHVIETQIRWDIDGGSIERGILIARRALEIEPRNEDLELSMLKLLRRAGAHSAAAEQYSRYANVLRVDLGIEAPPFGADAG